ncbi:MAG: conjugal transfer protein TrbF, partial [Lentisphaerae bacterium]|nr:conjugal transfer protein TrbF [Lentisphaerota bacterium]
MSKNLNTTPTTPITNPHLKARQAYDSLVGDALKRAKNWRLLALLLCVLQLVSIVSVTLIAKRGTIIPYVVEINEKGVVRLVGKADTTNYKPTEASIRYFTAKFVEKIRSIPDDIIILRKNIMDAYGFVSTKG